MFISKRTPLANASLLLLGLAWVGGCDDPTLARRPPELTAMVVFMLLDPDSTTQPLLAYAADGAGPIPNAGGEISSAGEVVAAEKAFQFAWPCSDRYGPLGGVGEPVCINFQLAPSYGTTYRITATADGFPPIAASVTIPGDFGISEVVARGSPPGSEEFQVRWTSSTGAHRYLVAVRPRDVPECTTLGACKDGWYAVAADTVLNAVVPAEEIEGSPGPWVVDVYALDASAFQYLTTGTSDDLFPVPPIQNVQGGYGAIGAWVRRSRDIP